MPDWLIDLSLVLGTYVVTAVVTAWGVGLVVRGGYVEGPDNSRSEGGEE